LKEKSIKLIKGQKVGLENLLGNSCLKRRIRRIAIRDYQMGEHKKPFSSIQHCTYKSIGATVFGNRRLRIERNDNGAIAGGRLFGECSTRLS
jgi:hypothetical protein